MKIRFLIGSLALVGLLSATHTASATMTGINLTISDITIDGGGGVAGSVSNARIFISTGLTGTQPGCAGTFNRTLAMDLSTNKGRALLSLAMAAMLSGKLVHITGGANCVQVGTTNYQELVQLTMI